LCRRQGGVGVIALAGNKADLASQRRVTTQVCDGGPFCFSPYFPFTQEAEAYAEDSGCLYMETSAKTNMNVAELFTQIATRLPKQEPETSPVLILDQPPAPTTPDRQCRC